MVYQTSNAIGNRVLKLYLIENAMKCAERYHATVFKYLTPKLMDIIKLEELEDNYKQLSGRDLEIVSASEKLRIALRNHAESLSSMFLTKLTGMKIQVW